MDAGRVTDTGVGSEEPRVEVDVQAIYLSKRPEHSSRNAHCRGTYDDSAAFLGAHVGCKELDQAKRAEEIGLEHGACLFTAGGHSVNFNQIQ